jgi:hypothetical protein
MFEKTRCYCSCCRSNLTPPWARWGLILLRGVKGRGITAFEGEIRTFLKVLAVHRLGLINPLIPLATQINRNLFFSDSATLQSTQWITNADYNQRSLQSTPLSSA